MGQGLREGQEGTWGKSKSSTVKAAWMMPSKGQRWPGMGGCPFSEEEKVYMYGWKDDGREAQATPLFAAPYFTASQKHGSQVTDGSLEQGHVPGAGTIARNDMAMDSEP